MLIRHSVWRLEEHRLEPVVADARRHEHERAQGDDRRRVLRDRPEIDAASREIRAASVRLNMSKNELLPALDLVLESYVSGIDADYDISQAWTDQFSVCSETMPRK